MCRAAERAGLMFGQAPEAAFTRASPRVQYWRQFDSTRQETAALPGPSSRLFSDAHYHGFWDRSSSRCLGISYLITEPEEPSFISSTAAHYRFDRRYSGHLAAFLFDLASPSFADFGQLIREAPRSTHRGPNASPITLHSRAPARRKAMSASTMAIAATYFMAAPRIGLLILDAGLPASSTSANLIMRLGLGRERIVSARRSSLSAMMPPRPTQPRHAILGMETMLVRFHCWLKFLRGVGDVHQMLQQHTRPDWSKRFHTLVRNRLRPPLRMVGRDQGRPTA